MKLNIFVLVVVGITLAVTYEPARDPPKSPELLEFVAECEEQNLIVTWITEDTVSCVPRR